MKEITLASGEITLVDDQDYEYLSRWRWCLHKNGNGRMSATRSKRSPHGYNTTIFMHREILTPPEGLFIDHIDGNPLNNQRHNLRIVTRAQNMQNSVKRSKTRTSKYKGVTLRQQTKKWVARIVVEGKQLHLGDFENEEEAARTYDDAAKRHFGEFARVNFDD